MNNHIKTVALLSLLTAALIWGGQLLGGQNGIWIALILAAVMNMGAYWFSDKIVLKMYRAKEITASDPSGVYDIVQNLATRMSLPMPRVYLVPEATANAFATGRNPQNAAVAVTAGLLKLLDRRELEGVLGHELGHIQNRDTLISSIAATFAGALSMLADMAMWGSLFGRGEDREAPHPLAGILGMILAPLAGMLIQSAISRSREFLADDCGATVTGNPLALASALQKIEQSSRQIPIHSGTPATAHLFIINPFKGKNLLSLFSTHPPTRERIRRLENRANPAFAIGS